MQYAVRCVVGIELRGAVGAPAADARDDLRRHVDDVMRELGHRWISESEVQLDEVRPEANFVVVVDAGDRQRAVSKAWGVLSMAVHAAGGASSHRPFPMDADWSVRLLAAKASERGQESETAAIA